MCQKSVPKSAVCDFRRLRGLHGLGPQLGATHRAEMRVLPSIMSNRLVMHLAGSDRILGDF